MKKINIAELLKDCPKGMELYSPITGECTLVLVDDNVIRVHFYGGEDEVSEISFYKYGNYFHNGECLLFPSKGKTTWEGFQRPFKDGDILAYTSSYTTVFIYRNKDNEPKHTTSFYVGYTIGASYCNFHIYDKSTLIALNGDCDTRFATEEEKEKLFQTIKENGYKWNAETKTLEKLPRFKVGDRIKHIVGREEIATVVGVEKLHYNLDSKIGTSSFSISISLQHEWELVPNKFDITTLKPYDKVLVRDNDIKEWCISFFSHCNGLETYKYSCINSCGYAQCIPYEGNEHLLGTTNDCDDFYKTWEK